MLLSRPEIDEGPCSFACWLASTLANRPTDLISHRCHRRSETRITAIPVSHSDGEGWRANADTYTVGKEKSAIVRRYLYIFFRKVLAVKICDHSISWINFL